MGRRAFRRCFGAILIIASLVIASFPTSEVNAEDTKSVVSDFEMNGNLLVKYTGTATTVSVPNGVKVIGEEAFANNSQMVSVSLPSSLEKISYAAFSGCNNLTKVEIPDSVEEIGTAAFCNCSKLAAFSLGKGTKKIGTGLFTGCPKLSTISDNDYFVCIDGVIYDDELETIYQVFQSAKCRKDETSNDFYTLKDYSMPNTVKNIMPYSFYGCKNIETVTFSNNIKEIPAYAFSYCNGLNNIKIPHSVNTINVKAFEYCINLQDVEIPYNVSFIHSTAFDGCSKLNIIAPVSSYAYQWFENFNKEEVHIIDTEDNDSELEDASGNKIDANSFVPKPIDGLIGETIIAGRQAVFFIDNTKITVHNADISDNSEEYSEMVEQMEMVLQEETNGKGLSLPKFAIIDNEIAGRAFYDDQTLKEYDISKGITSIGDFAFARSALKSITIPDNVIHIGYGAFYHCDDLTTILVPATVTDIEASAFNKTRMMENWYTYGEDDFMVLGDGILVAYKGQQTSVVIPDNVKQIGPEVFKNNKRIKEVTIPESVWRVCDEAFMGCSNLTSISGGMGLEVLDDRCFYGCPVSTVRITDKVRKIGLGAFDLDACNMDVSNRVVVFQGNTLPISTYNKTTTRLTNDAFREDSLEGINIAIVNSEEVNRLHSVLDRDESGFAGLICVITEPNNEYFNGTLKIIDCTLNASEANSVYIPSSVLIYGKGYNFLDEQLSSVMEMAKTGAYFESVEEEPYVTFNGSKERFTLDVVKDSYVNESVKYAYKRIYGDTVPANFTTYSIFITQQETGVKLSKFGKQTYHISIPLANNMPTTNLHVISLDEYNQLEDLPFEVVSDGTGLFVEFDISHTGNYGMYSFNSSAVAIVPLDASPDTGDWIHPKYFLALGLFALGWVMILIKRKEQIA